MIFINRETDAMLGTKKVLYCANIGDTACVLFSKSGCKKLSSASWLNGGEGCRVLKTTN